MREYIEERAVEIANYIIENNATVRQTAKQFRISKSTVHKDVTERLLQINPSLAHETRKVLDTNKSERHIRISSGDLRSENCSEGTVCICNIYFKSSLFPSFKGWEKLFQ